MKKTKIPIAKPTGQEIAINVLFWLAMTLSGVGLLIYGTYQFIRKISGKPFHYFKLSSKNTKSKTVIDESSEEEKPESQESSTYLKTSREIKKEARKAISKTEAVQESTEEVESEKAGEKTGEKTEENLVEGLVIHFKDSSNHPISADQQARFFLDRALKDLEHMEEGKGVALTYSANYGQTKDLAAAYTAGRPTANIGGSHQATVVKAIEKLLLKDDKYKPLQHRMHILPITTLKFGAHKPENIIVRDMKNVACHLGAGWKVYGWQNQDTNFSTSKKFAIGGGVVKNQDPLQYKIIQNSLLLLSERKDLLPKNSDGTWNKGVDAKVAEKYEAARKLGERTGDPLAVVKTWHKSDANVKVQAVKKQ